MSDCGCRVELKPKYRWDALHHPTSADCVIIHCPRHQVADLQAQVTALTQERNDLKAMSHAVIEELHSALAQAREAIRTLRAADPGLEHYLTIPDALCDAQVIKIKRVLEADAARSPTEPTQ